MAKTAVANFGDDDDWKRWATFAALLGGTALFVAKPSSRKQTLRLVLTILGIIRGL